MAYGGTDDPMEAYDSESDQEETLYNVHTCNRFVTDNRPEDDWQTQNSRKRRRFNTGSVNVAHFQTLSNDDKLAMLFGKLIDIEEKLPSFQKLQNTVDEIKGKAVITEKSINWHEQQIKTLIYKSDDLEARSRRRNLIFRGLYESRSEDCTDIIKQFLYDKLQLNPIDFELKKVLLPPPP